MRKIQTKPFNEPDEIVSVSGHVSQVVTLGDTYVAWSIAQPGWRWSKDVKPFSSHESIQRTIGPREAFDISLVMTVGWREMNPVYSSNFMVCGEGAWRYGATISLIVHEIASAANAVAMTISRERSVSRHNTKSLIRIL